MTMIAAGFLLGLVASGHCVGMCGPLVLSVGPRPQAPTSALFPRLLIYHGGRLSTYVLLALPAGLAGQLLSLRGLQRAAAVIGAVVLLAMAFDTRRLPGVQRLHRVFASAALRGHGVAAQWGRGCPALAPFALGAANGLMPCGMVYAAVAAAAASGSLADAVVMMTGFGLGTTPALVALSISAASVPLHVRMRLQRMTPAVLIVAAALLLARAVTPGAH
jgi:sulfite exporter TauE/SafE